MKKVILIAVFVSMCTLAHAEKVQDISPSMVGNTVATTVADVAKYDYISTGAKVLGKTVEYTLGGVWAVVSFPFKQLEKVRE